MLKHMWPGAWSTHKHAYMNIYRLVGLPTKGQSEVITFSFLLNSGEKIYLNLSHLAAADGRREAPSGGPRARDR